MTMDDTRVIHLKLNFVQTELPQTSSPSPFSPWPTRAKILAEFCRVFSSKTQVYCICTRRTTTTAYSTGISTGYLFRVLVYAQCKKTREPGCPGAGKEAVQPAYGVPVIVNHCTDGSTVALPDTV